MENERETLIGVLGDQVSQPLRALITGAPLEDARHLTHRYDKLRQEVEAQAAEVLRRRSKTRESDISAETCMKLRNAEARLSELRSTMTALGKEAVDAMLSVEAQQQQMTFEKLFTMVDAERAYHQHVIAILDKLCSELIEEEQSNESLFLEQSSKTLAQQQLNESALLQQSNGSPLQQQSNGSLLHEQSNKSSSQSVTMKRDTNITPGDEKINLNGSDEKMRFSKKDGYYIAKVVHPFDAQADGELNLSVGDYVVVRQVAPHGWSEGECKGMAGWFPSAYIKEEEKAPASKMMEVTSS